MDPGTKLTLALYMLGLAAVIVGPGWLTGWLTHKWLIGLIVSAVLAIILIGGGLWFASLFKDFH